MQVGNTTAQMSPSTWLASSPAAENSDGSSVNSVRHEASKVVLQGQVVLTGDIFLKGVFFECMGVPMA